MASEKILKALGPDTIDEMNTMDEHELQKTIVEANGAMKQVEEELEENEPYQEIKAKKSAMEQGKREVDKRQKARIRYSLTRLEEIGKLGAIDRKAWETERLKTIQARQNAGGMDPGDHEKAEEQ